MWAGLMTAPAVASSVYVNLTVPASMVHAADYLDFIEQKTGAKLPRDLRDSLKVCGDAFKVIRYHYEAPDKSRYYLTELPRMLYAYILERRPEWDADTLPRKRSPAQCGQTGT